MSGQPGNWPVRFHRGNDDGTRQEERSRNTGDLHNDQRGDGPPNDLAEHRGEGGPAQSDPEGLGQLFSTGLCHGSLGSSATARLPTAPSVVTPEAWSAG